MTISVVDYHAGEVIQAGPMTLRILEDGTHTEHRLGLVEITIPPRVDGPPQHIHRQHDETFFVISGAPTFTCGGKTLTAQPGTLVTAPPGTPHTFANPGAQPVVMLCTVTPDLYIGYFRDLGGLRPGPHGLDPREVAEVMARYATEVIRPTR
ncbi:MAG: cupin domain-containing protein [Chloroflexi bacterium]|nr:cupin domain-containing protein [Chloroflexota bacterium]